MAIMVVYIEDIRTLEKEVSGEQEKRNESYFEENRREVVRIVDEITGKIAGGQ